MQGRAGGRKDLAPDGQGNTPDRAGDIPNRAGNTPDCAGNTPDCADDTPDCEGNIPDSAGDTPDGAGNIPEIAGDTPEIADESPEMGGNTATRREKSLIPRDLRISQRFLGCYPWVSVEAVACLIDGPIFYPDGIETIQPGVARYELRREPAPIWANAEGVESVGAMPG